MLRNHLHEFPRPRNLSACFFGLNGCKGMFQTNVDEQIREAIARGEFDNLPGKGKALDLDAYFARLNI